MANKSTPKKPTRAKVTKVTFEPGKKRVLYVGCGEQGVRPMHPLFAGQDWQQVRMDSRVQVKPDIVANPVSMPIIGSGEYNGIFAPDVLGYYHSHQVPAVLKEMFRVLQMGGGLIMVATDLYKVAEEITKGHLEKPLYQTKIGPVTALDLVYGFRPAIEKDGAVFAYNTGFTAQTLGEKLRDAGFLSIEIKRDRYSLWVLAYKLPEGTPLKVDISSTEDINKMMQLRDELDKEPEIPVKYA